MKDCVLNELKSTINNSNLPILGYLQLLFDNTNTPIQTEQVNTIKMFLTSDVRSQFVNPDSLVYTTGWNDVALRTEIHVSTETAANTKAPLLIPIDAITGIIGLDGSGYSSKVGNIMYRMADIKRIKGLTNFSPFSLKVYDKDFDYDIDSLAENINLRTINFAGYYLNTWHGDIVSLIDKMISNGLNVSAGPIIVLNASTSSTSIKVNGTWYSSYIHVVVTASGYSIYAPINSSTALGDYSSYTPVYTKTL